MYSTRCTNCRQLINLKTEEVREAVEQAEAKHDKLYTMHCPKCRRLLKIQVSDLKRKLPVAMPAPAEAPAGTDEDTPAS